MTLPHRGLLCAVPGSATPSVIGLPGLTLGGCTATLRNPATATEYERYPRLSFVASSTAINAVMTMRQNLLHLSPMRAGVSQSGFRFSARFAISDAAAYPTNGSRMFLGLVNTAAALAGADPAALTNCIGVGHNSGDTNLFLYYGGSAAQTRIDTEIALSAIYLSHMVDFTVTFMEFPTSRAFWSAGDVWRDLETDPSGHVGWKKSGHIDLSSTVFPTGLLTFSAMRQKLTATGTVGIDLHRIEVDKHY